MQKFDLSAPKASEAVQKFYAELKGGDPNSAHEAMFNFGDMSDMLGIDAVASLQDKYPNA